MAEAKHSGMSADSQVTRRNILIAAPASGFAAMLAGAAPVAAMAETPVRRAYLEWLAFRDQINGDATKGMKNTEFDPLVDELDDMGLALLTIPSETPADFVMKVIASTDWGQGAMPDITEMPNLWAESRALVGA